MAPAKAEAYQTELNLWPTSIKLERIRARGLIIAASPRISLDGAPVKRKPYGWYVQIHMVEVERERNKG